VKNTVSGSVNIGGGIGIGLALGLIPVTGGVSILLIAGGSFMWGMYGTDFSNEAGTYVEELLFD
jgi:hypothetical protein